MEKQTSRNRNKSFLDYITPDNISGISSIFLYRILMSVFFYNIENTSYIYEVIMRQMNIGKVLR